jgi:hypothetical protein
MASSHRGQILLIKFLSMGPIMGGTSDFSGPNFDKNVHPVHKTQGGPESHLRVCLPAPKNPQGRRRRQGGAAANGCCKLDAEGRVPAGRGLRKQRELAGVGPGGHELTGVPNWPDNAQVKSAGVLAALVGRRQGAGGGMGRGSGDHPRAGSNRLNVAFSQLPAHSPQGGLRLWWGR